MEKIIFKIKRNYPAGIDVGTRFEYRDIYNNNKMYDYTIMRFDGFGPSTTIYVKKTIQGIRNICFMSVEGFQNLLYGGRIKIISHAQSKIEFKD
jgi:hypothetical protein